MPRCCSRGWSLARQQLSTRRRAFQFHPPERWSSIELRFSASDLAVDVPIVLPLAEAIEDAREQVSPVWVFAGSLVRPNPSSMGPGEYYAADYAGTVVGLSTFGDEVVAVEEVRSPESGVDPPVWRIRAGVLPEGRHRGHGRLEAFASRGITAASSRCAAHNAMARASATSAGSGITSSPQRLAIAACIRDLSALPSPVRAFFTCAGACSTISMPCWAAARQDHASSMSHPHAGRGAIWMGEHRFDGHQVRLEIFKHGDQIGMESMESSGEWKIGGDLGSPQPSTTVRLGPTVSMAP